MLLDPGNGFHVSPEAQLKRILEKLDMVNSMCASRGCNNQTWLLLREINNIQDKLRQMWGGRMELKKLIMQQPFQVISTIEILQFLINFHLLLHYYFIVHSYFFFTIFIKRVPKLGMVTPCGVPCFTNGVIRPHYHLFMISSFVLFLYFTNKYYESL